MLSNINDSISLFYDIRRSTKLRILEILIIKLRDRQETYYLILTCVETKSVARSPLRSRLGLFVVHRKFAIDR